MIISLRRFLRRLPRRNPPIQEEHKHHHRDQHTSRDVVPGHDAELLRECAAEQAAEDRAEAGLHEREHALPLGDAVLVDVFGDEGDADHVADHVAEALRQLPEHDQRNDAGRGQEQPQHDGTHREKQQLHCAEPFHQLVRASE